MKTIDQKRQAALRKTLFPLSPKEISAARSRSAYAWHLGGYSYAAIRQILKLSGPDEARRLVAKQRKNMRARFS